jgi:predicted secreted protein
MFKRTLCLFFLLSLSLQLDLDGAEIFTIARSDTKPSFSITSSQKFALKFSSNPTTGSDWYLLNSDEVKSTGIFEFLNLNANNGGEFVPEKHEKRIAGYGGNTYFLMKSNEILGEVELRFEYKRIWENGNVMEKTVVIKVAN